MHKGTHMTSLNRLMTSANSSGDAGVFHNLARYAALAFSAVVGIFVLLLTASAALVVVLSLVFIGLIVFVFFWARAKFLGKSRRATVFEDLQAAAQSGRNPQRPNAGLHTRAKPFDEGDIIDAHETPDGWTVDE